MKKIIFGITGLTLGGAERVLVDMANRLSAKYDITIFTIYSKGEIEKELNKNIHLISLYDCKYSELSKKDKIIIPFKVLFNRKKIFKEYIDKEEYIAQISFLEGPITRIFSTKSKFNLTRKIAWVHNDISKVFGKNVKAKMKAKLDKNIYEKYDTLVFVSRDNLEKFNKFYNDIDLPNEVVINNYIDDKRILELSKKKIEKDIFNKKSVNILQVSRLVEQKGISRLIDVHIKLIKQGYNHKIFIIGDGPLKEELERKIEQLKIKDSFILLGAKTNPYPYISNCDYLALFSFFEGYPMVIEEGKILKKFILSTNTATRENLINYLNSKIVDNTKEGIEEAIKFAIKNKNTKVENDFIYDNEKILLKIEKILEENKKHPNRTFPLEG